MFKFIDTNKEYSISVNDTLYNLPYIIKKTVRDRFTKDSLPYSIYENVIEKYLKEVIEWILTAQKVYINCGGIPAKYSLYGGYTNPYPETSGYIITSLLNSYRYFHIEAYRAAAIDIADWLMSRQLVNGAMRCNKEHPDINHSDDSEIYLFDCGAILEGLTNIWKDIPNNEYKLSALKLADYIISNREKNGLWQRDLYFPYFGSHQARTMWSLINAGQTFNKTEYIELAIKSLNRIKTSITTDYYINNCHFTQREQEGFAFMHPVAYTIEGFLKAGVALELNEFTEIACEVAYKLHDIAMTQQNMLYSHYDTSWKPISNYQCVPGNIQIAMVWLDIAKHTDNNIMIPTAIKYLNYIRDNMIDIQTSTKGIRGGVQGSFPIYGKYMAYCYPNWGSKFFIDASLLEIEVLRAKKSAASADNASDREKKQYLC